MADATSDYVSAPFDADNTNNASARSSDDPKEASLSLGPSDKSTARFGNEMESELPFPNADSTPASVTPVSVVENDLPAQ